MSRSVTRTKDSSPCRVLIGGLMKFRFVLLGPDDEPNDLTPPPGCAAGLLTSTSGLSRYEQRGAGMVRIERPEKGRAKVTALANFSARIVGDLIVDDGDQELREFRLEAEVAGQTLTFSVSAVEFSGMGWVLKRLGPQAIVYPGQQHHARAAIQWLSGQIRQERIFAHLGWCEHGPHWMYLHAGGALGVDGPLPSVQVQLPAALQSYHLLPSKDAGGRVSAVQASLQFLSLAPDRITFPLLAAVYRAPLGSADFSLFLTGQTGVFKTALAALCQQHFGAGLDASRLPANFASTAPALQWLAFHAKDALLVVDDFAPTGRNSDSQLQSVSEGLFRSAGNQQYGATMTTPETEFISILGAAGSPEAPVRVSSQSLPEVLPILGLSDIVIFPGMVAPLLVETPQSTKLIDDVVGGDRLLGGVLQRNAEAENPLPSEMYDVGCAARVLKMLKFPDNTVRVLVEGLWRMKIKEYPMTDPYLCAKFELEIG